MRICATSSSRSTTRRSVARRATPSRRGSRVGDADLDADPLSRGDARGRPGQHRRRSTRLALQIAQATRAPHLRRARRDRPAASERPVLDLAGRAAARSLRRRPASPWTLPRLWSGRSSRPPHKALGPAADRRPPAHSAHRRHYSESGQITCQTKADNSLVNNSSRRNSPRRTPRPRWSGRLREWSFTRAAGRSMLETAANRLGGQHATSCRGNVRSDALFRC